jgi:sugar/nucleoside kinase (ribokinase family)
MVDVFASLDEEEARRLGVTEPVQHLDYEKIRGIFRAIPRPVFSAGGGAANVARIAALLGVPSQFIGAIGLSGPGKPDAFGRFFTKSLVKAGVLPSLAGVRVPTGICLILALPGGKTRIAASPSAALGLDEPDIPESAIREAAVLSLDGFLLGREALVRHILEGVCRYGTTLALDTGSAAIAADRAGEIVRYCRDYPLILFMNEAEAEAFCQALTGKGTVRHSSPEADGDSLSGAVQALLQNLSAGGRGPAGDRGPFPLIVVKRGPRGAVIFAQGQAYPAAAEARKPRDSTGAGDAFAAAFLAAFIRCKSLAECADLGNRTARESLDVPGAAIPRKKLREIVKRLQSGET